MRTTVKSVLVHSCELQPAVRPESSLQLGMKYVLVKEDPDVISTIPFDGTGQYFALRDKCNCRQLVTFAESENLLKIGGAKAIWQLNIKKKRMDLCQLRKQIFQTNPQGKKEQTGVLIETHIWRRQQVKVPRVDVISFKDIQRAYLDDHHFYIDYIESVHDLYMQNRLDLFAPEVANDLKRLYFSDQDKTKRMQGEERRQLEQTADKIKAKGAKDDPTEGRLIFPFPSDERTKGGHE
jgi:hypothetical protein